MTLAVGTHAQFERAVFTSTGSSSVRGYHLVNRSSGIDDDIAQTLCQWSPTHDGLADPSVTATSLNYFVIDEQNYAISKSLIGGAEYSGRQAFQTVTTIIVGKIDKLPAYGNNPIVVAKMALSMGWLRLLVDYRRPLEPVSLSAGCLTATRTKFAPDAKLERAVRALQSGNRVALVGTIDPVQSIARIFERLTPDVRVKTSFATGIKPSTFRPFQVHFFAKLDNRLRDFLRQQQIITITPESIE